MYNGPHLGKDDLSNLKDISEARIARHGLPVGLMARTKASRDLGVGGWLGTLGKHFRVSGAITGLVLSSIFLTSV